MRQIFHVLIVVASAFAVTACVSGQERSTPSLDETAPGELVVAAADTGPEWVPDDATDTDGVDVSPDVCRKIIHHVGAGNCPAGQPCPCPSGFTCLYQDTNREGFGVGISSGCRIRNLTNISCPGCTNGEHGKDGTFNDQMSSWQNANGDGRQSCWWFDIGEGPPRIVMPDGTTHSKVTPANNDQASEFGACG